MTPLRAGANASIWVMALGYFLFYAPYSAAVKATSKGLWPGVEGQLSRIEILPGFFLGAALVLFSFIAFSGWWRHVPERQVFGITARWPRRLTALSGVGTAAIIAATTLAYTFHGISIVFALLLMRGGVLIMAPLVDALFGRQVERNSWIGLSLSLVAVGIALADQNSYVLSTAAVLNLAFYYTGYIARLQCITALVKAEEPAARPRFFVEEQLTSMTLLLLGCAGLVLFGVGENTTAAQLFQYPTLLIGVLYGCLFLFGSMIYMDTRENCFCVPINRCSSVLAGLVASVAMIHLLDQPPISNAQFLAAGVIILAILALGQPALSRAARQNTDEAAAPVRKLLLFVCDGNTSRSPIAEAICRSELAARFGLAGQAGAAEIQSAGLNPTPDRPLAPNAALALTELGVEVNDHRSRKLTDDMVKSADLIYCMTDEQRTELISRFPDAAGRTHCLDPDREIENPSGGTPEVFHSVARHIRASVLRRLEEFTLASGAAEVPVR